MAVTRDLAKDLAVIVVGTLLLAGLLAFFQLISADKQLHSYPIYTAKFKWSEQSFVNRGGEFLVGEFNVTLPDFDPLIEAFMDVLWDIDGDSNFDGLFIVIFNFIPGFGSQGTVFIVPAIYLSVALGAIVLAKRMRER